MKIRTTEPVADEQGKIWPTGTKAESTPVQPVAPGMDFATDTGEILWQLMPMQYERVKK